MTADTAAKKDNAFKDAAGSKIFFHFTYPFFLLLFPHIVNPITIVESMRLFYFTLPRKRLILYELLLLQRLIFHEHFFQSDKRKALVQKRKTVW